MMLECMECGMWRHSKKKLSRCDRKKLEEALDEWDFTCEAQLQDLELSGPLAVVYVREVNQSKSCIIRRSMTPSVCFVLNLKLPQVQTIIHSVEIVKTENRLKRIRLLICGLF